MRRLFVGCRVRILWSNAWPTRFDPDSYMSLEFAPSGDQLEPIQPEGALPCGMCFEKVMQDLTQLANEVPA